MGLYPNYRPLGIKAEWECASLSKDSARECLYRKGGRDQVPLDAVAWFDDAGQLRRLVADYSDGRRADLRITRGGYRLSHTTPEARP